MNCSLAVSDQTKLRDGGWLLHLLTATGAHCDLLDISSGGQRCVVRDGETSRPVDTSRLCEDMASASDRKALVLCQLHPDQGAEDSPALVDLLAGTSADRLGLLGLAATRIL